MPDPRESTTYRVRVTASTAEDTRALADVLRDVPTAMHDDAVRLEIATDDLPIEDADAHVVLDPTPTLTVEATGKPIFRVKRDRVRPVKGNQPCERDFVLGPSFEGVDLLRASLLCEALKNLGATEERVLRAKRPFAIGIVASATLVAALEGVLPAAAGFVVATQVNAIGALHYLYRGKWLGRTHAIALLPVVASETAGGSIFLLAKSFFPPTGIGDVAAAVIAASMTLAMLGAIAKLLEQGYSLEEREKLRTAFLGLYDKTRAERAYISRNRHLWKDKAFFRRLVTRLVFE